ncbi:MULTISPECIES: DUF488 domain-containing protein [unclassified Corynebacterium]|uniref:DUF488 domain-containing protein n=1 Tax=unclassified Corynebacterium TaxID=2624378 RepID=UPI0029C9BBBA|nr:MULTISPECIES: DUF488 family protein [unclassified Corynebacterium]WPF66719.1 DUF488 family protein [Corynebacterium sp. 22KM0430]WPF69207.1 DUF488 family protein [Corynebacterium sp. 21KM1197]
MSVTTLKVHDLLQGSAHARGSAVLVDRLWPRGVAKSDLAHDLWLREVAPSPDLRRWFGHDPQRFEEFSRRYREELDEGNAEVDRLVEMVRAGDVCLLYAARDREHNHAAVLAEWLNDAARLAPGDTETVE